MSSPEELLGQVSNYDTARKFLARAQERPEAAREAFGDDLFRQMVSAAGDAVKRKERPTEAAPQLTSRYEDVRPAAEAERNIEVSGPPAPNGERPKPSWALTQADIPNLDELVSGSSRDVARAAEIQAQQYGQEHDESLPTLSKVRSLAAPPEYTPEKPSMTSRLLGLGSKLSPAAGVVRDTMTYWEEPSEEAFHEALKPYPQLYTGPIERVGTDTDLYRQFADAAWQDAIERAKAEGRRIVRLSQMPGISGTVARGASTVRAGVLGAERGLTGGLGSAAVGRLLPGFREAAEDVTAAHPVATTIGFAAPAFTPLGELSVAGRGGSLALRGLGRVLPAGRLGANVARGAAAAAAGGAAERAAMLGADAISGQPVDPMSAATDVADAGLVAGLVGGPLGGLQSAANASRRALRSGGSPLAQALRDAEAPGIGSRTSLLRGMSPGPAVRSLNAGGAASEARLAEEISGPMLREARRESGDYERLLNNATDAVLQGGQRMTDATKATIRKERISFYRSPAGQRIRDIAPFRESARRVANKFSVATGSVIPGRSAWRKKAKRLFNETAGDARIFLGRSARDAEQQALDYANRRGLRDSRNRPVLEHDELRRQGEVIPESPEEQPRIFTLNELRAQGINVDRFVRRELRANGIPWRAGEPLPKQYRTLVGNARAVWSPLRMNAEEIDELIDSVDDMLREGAKTGTVPTQFNELSEAAHSLRDQLGASNERMAAETYTLPNGTVIRGYGAMMRRLADTTGEIKRNVQQAGVPERAGGISGRSDLNAGEMSALRNRVAGRNELAPEERRSIELLGNRWSAAPPAWGQMSSLERSAGAAGLKYPLPAEIKPEQVTGFRQRLVRFGEPLQAPTDRELMGMASRAGKGPRLRLMPGVRATNQLQEASRMRRSGGMSSFAQGGAYGRAGLSDAGALLRWDAVMRYLQQRNSGAAGGATVSPKGERRLPVLAQQIQKYW